ncbi:hypothetical protein RSAG8_09641, partial [Rhizoctonia solani AG-8 WAC10335]
MGLCGADSSVPRGVSVQKFNTGMLADVEFRRNPDTFLVVRMMIASRTPLLRIKRPCMPVYGAFPCAEDRKRKISRISGRHVCAL